VFRDATTPAQTPYFAPNGASLGDASPNGRISEKVALLAAHSAKPRQKGSKFASARRRVLNILLQ